MTTRKSPTPEELVQHLWRCRIKPEGHMAEVETEMLRKDPDAQSKALRSRLKLLKLLCPECGRPRDYQIDEVLQALCWDCFKERAQ